MAAPLARSQPFRLPRPRASVRASLSYGWPRRFGRRATIEQHLAALARKDCSRVRINEVGSGKSSLLRGDDIK